MRIACIQSNPQENLAENINFIENEIYKLKQKNIEVVVLPEMFSFMGKESQRKETGDFLHEGVFSKIKNLCEQLNISIVAGSHSEKNNVDFNKIYNTCVAFDNQGQLLSVYRKLHLFNLKDKDGQKLYCESDVFLEGAMPGVFDLKIGNEVWNALTIICYDIRFPEIIRNQQKNIDIIFVPAAFTWQTGKDHWEVLLRARAIENQCYVVACNQTGFFSKGQKRNYGHSMIIDPWGNVTDFLSEECGFLVSNLTKEKIQECRMRLPALNDRKL
jgi:predicted amidohydrolase